MKKRNGRYVLLGSAALIALLIVGAAVIAGHVNSGTARQGGEDLQIVHDERIQIADVTVPPGAPLNATYDRLRVAAASGSNSAARRLFSEVNTCLRIASVSQSLAELSRHKDWLVLNSDYFRADGEAGTARQAQLIENVGKSIEVVDSASTLCGGIDSSFDDGRIYDLARMAAQAGDDTAATCLLSGPFEGPELNEAEGLEYRNEAMRLGGEAIDRGSWGAVKAMVEVYSSENMEGYMRYTRQRNPSAQLRYTMLLRLGTPDGSPYGKALDESIAFLATHLPQETRDSAREWAQSTYRRRFFFSGPPDPNLASCTP